MVLVVDLGHGVRGHEVGQGRGSWASVLWPSHSGVTFSVGLRDAEGVVGLIVVTEMRLHP